MKKLYKLVVVACSLVFSISQSYSADVVFFTFANCVRIDSDPTFLYADGVKLRQQGFKSGEATGGIGFPAGVKKIRIEHGDAKPLEIPLTLDSSNSPILVAYMVDEINPTSKEVKHILKATMIRSQPENHRLEIVGFYVSDRPELALTANNQPLVLSRLKEVSIPLQKTEVELKFPDGEIYRNSFEDASREILFMFDNDQNKTGSVLVHANTYLYHE